MNKPKSPILPTKPTKPTKPDEPVCSQNNDIIKTSFELNIYGYKLTSNKLTITSFIDLIIKNTRDVLETHKWKYKSFEIIEDSISFYFDRDHYEDEIILKYSVEVNVELTDKAKSDEVMDYEKKLKRYEKDKIVYDQKYQKYLKLKEQYDIDHKVYLEKLRYYEILNLENKLKKLKKEI